jgi:hypothetical protein
MEIPDHRLMATMAADLEEARCGLWQRPAHVPELGWVHRESQVALPEEPVEIPVQLGAADFQGVENKASASLNLPEVLQMNRSQVGQDEVVLTQKAMEGLGREPTPLALLILQKRFRHIG